MIEIAINTQRADDKYSGCTLIVPRLLSKFWRTVGTMRGKWNDQGTPTVNYIENSELVNIVAIFINRPEE